MLSHADPEILCYGRAKREESSDDFDEESDAGSDDFDGESLFQLSFISKNRV